MAALRSNPAGSGSCDRCSDFFRGSPGVTRIAAVILAIACPVATASAQPLTDPYQIFARARAYWLQQHYPPMLEYTVAVSVLEGGTIKAQRYWSAYDSVNREVAVDPISDYEKTHPTYASGGLNLIFFSHALSKPQPPTDYL